MNIKKPAVFSRQQAFFYVQVYYLSGRSLSGKLLGFGIIHAEGFYGYGLHYLRLKRLVGKRIGGCASNLVDYFKSLDNLAECGIFTVEMG